MFTGAEKPRLIDSTGREGMPSNCTVWLRAVRCSTSPLARPPEIAVGSASLPSDSTRPKRRGMCMTSLFGWPGVGGTDCSKVAVKRWATGSQSVETVTTGVPAWRYQRENWPRSAPFASSKQAMKSSIVAAWPSWRSK